MLTHLACDQTVVRWRACLVWQHTHTVTDPTLHAPCHRSCTQALKDKAATMSRFGIPGLIQKLVILPAVKKDAATVMALYRALAQGQQQQPAQAKRRGFLCFAA